MSIFGLSPLFLSLVASKLFTASDQTLDIPGFFTFMAVITGVVHCASTLVFRANRSFEVDAGEDGAGARAGEGLGEAADREHGPRLAAPRGTRNFTPARVGATRGKLASGPLRGPLGHARVQSARPVHPKENGREACACGRLNACLARSY